MFALKQNAVPVYFDGIRIPASKSNTVRHEKPATIVLDRHSSASSLPLMGGKAANLHLLSGHGVPVPEWVCVSSQVCCEALSAYRCAIEGYLGNIDFENPASIAQASDSIVQLIERAQVPDELRLDVERALTRIGASHFAVRSSALVEDSAGSSYAGLFDTFLYVARTDVVDRIRSCWASAFMPGNLAYSQRRNVSGYLRPVAVVIQTMIDSETAGVMFMANPAGSVDEIVLVSGYGLGEGVVADQVETDTCIYDRSRRAWRCDIGLKRKCVRFDAAKGRGTVIADVAESRQRAPVLTEEQCEALREQGEKISRLYEQFQDIEWAFDAAGDLFITQSRPITTIPRGQQSVFDNSNIVESYPGITSPLTMSHIRHCYAVVFRNALLRLGASKKRIRRHGHAFENMLGYIGGRVYYNLSNWYQMFRLVPAVEPYLPVWEEMLGISTRVDRSTATRLQRLLQVPRIAWVGARISWYFLFLNVYMNRCARSFRRIEKEFRSTDLTKLNNHELVALHDSLGRDVLDGWEITLLNDLYAFVFTASVRRQFRNLGLDDNVFGGLMAGDVELESTAPVRSLITLADGIRRDQNLRRQLDDSLDLPADDRRFQALDELFDDAAWVAGLRHHLQRFGERCPEELKLESVCFRDDPQSLLRLVSTCAASNADLALLDEHRFETRLKAEARLRSELNGQPLRRRLITWTLSLARRSIRYRESSRLDRARAFGLTRAIFRTLGRNLADEGALEKSEDVFFLTVSEVLGFVTGVGVNRRLQRLVNERKVDKENYQGFTPAERLKTQGTVGANRVPTRPKPAADESNGSLSGTGCSAGLVTAAAVLVQRPGDAGDVTGKVLVAEMTDPGWVFLMVSAAGLVVEKGSLLSHTAIIGRELGIPTVVGVAGATALIRSGQVVTVNGQSGEISLQSEIAT